MRGGHRNQYQFKNAIKSGGTVFCLYVSLELNNLPGSCDTIGTESFLNFILLEVMIRKKNQMTTEFFKNVTKILLALRKKNQMIVVNCNVSQILGAVDFSFCLSPKLRKMIS